MPVRSTTFNFESGSKLSNIVPLPVDAYLTTLFIPNALLGNTLTFLGDLGDGEMRLLNFSFDLTSSDPVYRGQIVVGLVEQFTGISRLQLQSDIIQTSNVSAVGGYTY